MKDDRPLDTEAQENVGHLARHRAVRHPERLVLGARGIAEGSDHIENGTHAELAARDAGKAERRVEDGREQEPDAGFVDAPRDAFGTQVDLHAQLLEHVGRATHRGGGAVAVLGDPRSRCRRDDRG